MAQTDYFQAQGTYRAYSQHEDFDGMIVVAHNTDRCEYIHAENGPCPSLLPTDRWTECSFCIHGHKYVPTTGRNVTGSAYEAPEARRYSGDPGQGHGRSTQSRRRNQYAGTCVSCGGTVDAEAGFLTKAGGKWAVEHDGPCPQRVAVPETPKSDVRRNRYDAKCVRCDQWVKAEAGALVKDANGKWAADHIGPCPAPIETGPADGYEPERGDVHVLDGTYYRIHIAQKSERPYACQAEIVRPATWGEDGTLVEPGIIEWHYDEGALPKLSEATKATPEQSAAFGHLVGRCCFCSHAIDTPESTTAGYGPVCAEKYGLPWGETLEVTSC